MFEGYLMTGYYTPHNHKELITFSDVIVL